MKRSTLVLGVVFAVMLSLTALFLIGGTLRAKVDVRSANAADYPKAYKSIAKTISSGSAPQLFTDGGLPDAASCRLEDVTITLSNLGFIPAEWLYVHVDGAPGDVAVYSITGEGGNIAPRSTGTINLKLVSDARGTGERTYHIEYYVFGMKRSIAVKAQV